MQRKAVDLNIKGQIQRQFGVDKNWHSPSDLHKSALYGLHHGLGLTRIVIFEVKNDTWQAFGRAGCKEHAELGSLTLPIQSSSILMEFTKRVTALWDAKGQERKRDSKRTMKTTAITSNDSITWILPVELRIKVRHEVHRSVKLIAVCTLDVDCDYGSSHLFQV